MQQAEELLLLFLTFSALVANPKKTTLHGGQSRSWSAEQGKKGKEKVWQRIPPPPPPARCSFGEKKKRIKKKIENHAAHPHGAFFKWRLGRAHCLSVACFVKRCFCRAACGRTHCIRPPPPSRFPNVLSHREQQAFAPSRARLFPPPTGA